MRCLLATTTVCLLGLLGMGASRNAQAEAKQMPWEPSPPPRLVEDRLRLEVGIWNAGIDTSVRSDATPTQPGTTLDGETDVGLDDNSVMPDFELTLLAAQRHLFRINSFSSRRSGTAPVTRDFLYDGHLYRVGQTVKGTLNLDMLGVGYAYRLLKAPTYEIDLGLDVQITSVEAKLVDSPATFFSEGVDGVVPIPMLDTEGRWEFRPRWQLLGRYRWAGASSSDGSGRMADWRIGVQWQFSQHLGIGLHYRNFDIQVDSTSNSNPGALDMKYKGAQLAFRASL